MKRIKIRKLIIRFLILGTIVALISIPISNRIIRNSAKNKIYSSSAKIPHNKVGLLLGTSKYLSNGTINQYYKNRIDATLSLYKAGKIDFIIVSGDNSRKEYDEPTTIKNDLIAGGIPAEKIFLDYAGFRTLDSVVRCDKIFGQKSITIISQKFHNERAVFIAKYKGIKAIGFNAKDVQKYYGFKTQLREKFARVKTMIDLLFGKDPKFLGEKIEINS
ncbi:MAG: protein SanA [Bacteroidetes bacterium HGW-Bacteroidetes-20]|nr:MAG: protein SanA [Bacteroidetes bacterium HGW-Bacteroidetes-20]